MASSLLKIPAPLAHSGKVRDTYDLGNDRLLMVASDRISAFDVVLPTSIHDKGVVLTQLSNYWFGETNGIVANHLTGARLAELGWSQPLTEALADRSVIVRRAERIPVECVVRGYLAGSGWVEYERSGSVAGHGLPSGLKMSAQLPEPIFTPARKNDAGHDQNITIAELRDEVGRSLADELEALSLAVYQFAAQRAAGRDVLIADTKFEFGYIDGILVLIDELLTPDSSRFWDASTWRPGGEPESWDKQYVRNWLIKSGWNREAPGPDLPLDVIAGTQLRYLEAFERITGRTLEQWLRQTREEMTA